MSKTALDPRIPTGQISWLVGQLHVSTTDQEVRDAIGRRAVSNRWPADLIPQAQDYAVECHRKNQHLVSRFRL